MPVLREQGVEEGYCLLPVDFPKIPGENSRILSDMDVWVAFISRVAYVRNCLHIVAVPVGFPSRLRKECLLIGCYNVEKVIWPMADLCSVWIYCCMEPLSQGCHFCQASSLVVALVKEALWHL